MTGNGVRHFLDLIDISKPVLAGLIDNSRAMKAARAGGVISAPLAGKTLAMIFDKPSTRTRVSFDVAMRQLGGEAILLTAQEMQLGRVHPGCQHVVAIAAPGHRAAADRPALLLERHHVGQHLARMRTPGEPVDYRHRGVARKLGHRLVIENTDHDRVDIAREHARGVGQRLAAPELHFLRGEQDRFAAELAHGDVERHACARRRLVEDHRQRLAGQRRADDTARPRGLHGAAVVDHPGQHRLRNVDEIEEMPHAVSGHDAAFCLAAWSACRGCARASRAQARSMRANASAISFSPIISGGSSRTTLSPAATVISFSLRNSSTISDAGGTMRRPISRPSPRTSAITEAWRSFSSASRCLSTSEFFRTRSRKPFAVITSSAALPAAIASGLPPKVEPWVPAVMPLDASAVARQAPIGIPPPSAFASVMISGVTPVCS